MRKQVCEFRVLFRYLASSAGPISETKSTSLQGQVLTQIRNRKGLRAEGKRLGSAIRSWPKGGGCFWAWFGQMGITQQPLQPGTNPFSGHWGPLLHAWYLSSSPLLLAQSLGFVWGVEAFHHQAVAWLSRMSFPQHKLHSSFFVCMRAKLLQSCPTLCNLMDCSLPGFYVHGDSPGKNTGVGCHFLLQRIFPTQGRDRTSVSYIYLHWQAGSLPLMSPGKPLVVSKGRIILHCSSFSTT